MITILALPLLFEDVKTQLAADASTANVVFGWRERTKRNNQGPGSANRVVFEPGEDKGKAGEYTAPVKDRRAWGTRSIRSLQTFKETCTVECWAYDETAPNDELAQYTAARHLHDHVVRAIYLSPRVGHGSFEIKDPTWITDKKELRFGAAIKFTLIVQAKIADDPGPPRDLDTEATTAQKAISQENLLTKPDGTDPEIDGHDEVPPA